MNLLLLSLTLGLAFVALVAAAVSVRARSVRLLEQARSRAKSALEEATREAEGMKQRALLEAKEKQLAERTRIDAEISKQRTKLRQDEVRVEQAARAAEQQAADLETRSSEIESRQRVLAENERSVEAAKAAAEQRLATLDRRLEEIAGMTQEQARVELTRRIEDDVRRQMAAFVKRSREETEESIDRTVRRIVSQAIYRSGARPMVQSTITPMTLPSDEIKGRIIGREGRNIRALEAATGVDIIIDDTPHTLLLSSYDPARREMARISIERLIEDGRVHPARIEEVTAKVREEMEDLTLKAGEAAALELGLAEIHPRLHRLLGRLKFRLSHGQNLLQHSLEVAHLAGYMAAEIGARTDVVRRAGLLHEVSQVEDEPPSVPIVLASGDLVARFGESQEVVHAIKALDRSVEPRTMEALLIAAANKISEARPGARKDNLEVFIERLRAMERIALSFTGIKRAFAVRSGKELRVMVESDQVSDDGVVFLSHDIATRIEKEVDYPGQVRVSVIREIRAIDFAV